MSAPAEAIGSQALKFLLVGGVSSGSHYGIYVALVALTAISPTVATVLGFVVGTVLSYALNSRYTFRADQTGQAFVRFWIVTGTGGAINAALVEIGVRLGIHYTLSGIGAIGIAASFNFLAHRYWTFAKPLRADPVQ